MRTTLQNEADYILEIVCCLPNVAAKELHTPASRVYHPYRPYSSCHSNLLLPLAPRLPTLLLLVVLNEVLHDIIQSLVSPRNQEHIVRVHGRSPSMACKGFEIDGRIFCSDSSERTIMLIPKEQIPICAHTISVSAPMNCGVAIVFRRRVSSSTSLPIENQREALSFWCFVSSIFV